MQCHNTEGKKNGAFQQLRKLAATLDSSNSLISHAKICKGQCEEYSSSESNCSNTVSRLLAVTDETRSLKDEIRSCIRHVQQQSVVMRDITTACGELLNIQNTTLTQIEEYLSQYGYKSFEKCESESKEASHDKVKRSATKFPSVKHDATPEAEQDASRADKENVENRQPDDDQPPRIENFGFSRDFMERYLTGSISKTGSKIGIQLKDSVQKSNAGSHVHESRVSKQLQYETQSIATPTYFTPCKAPASNLHLASTPGAQSDDSPFTLPVPPILMTPGVKQIRQLDSLRSEASSGGTPEVTFKMMSPSMMQQSEEESFEDAPPQRPIFNFTPKHMANITENFKTLRLHQK